MPNRTIGLNATSRHSNRAGDCADCAMNAALSEPLMSRNRTETAYMACECFFGRMCCQTNARSLRRKNSRCFTSLDSDQFRDKKSLKVSQHRQCNTCWYGTLHFFRPGRVRGKKNNQRTTFILLTAK